MNTIKKPLLTEKTLQLYKDQHKVTFEVGIDANKTQAAKDLSELYSVKVLSITTNSRLGKRKYSRFSKTFGKSPNRKFMIFKLDDKSNIDFFETK